MFSVFTLFAVLMVVSGYVCARGIFCITKIEWLSALLVLISVTAPLSFGMHRVPAQFEWTVRILRNFGYIYLGFMLYFSMFCVVAFSAYYIGGRYGYKIPLPKVMICGVCSVVVILIGGYINAVTPQLKKIHVPSPSSGNVQICFVSDIHLGSISTIRILNKVVELIDQAQPDVVILGGDIIDIKSIEPYGAKFEEIMRKVTSRYRTYAVIGNHEIYAGAQDCVDLMKKSGISMLLDKVIDLNGFSIVGRLDKRVENRKTLKKILLKNTNNPIIVVDHAPEAIEESVENGAFLHLSGHTHAGQMFPMNLVVNFMYKPTCSLKKIGNMHYYITCGAGFWGPPYRIGNIPEVVLVEVGN